MSKVKKTKPTVQDFKRWGRTFRRLRRDMMGLHWSMTTHLSRSDTQTLEKAWINLNKARSHLENSFFRHFPDDASINTFYGDPDKEDLQ